MSSVGLAVPFGLGLLGLYGFRVYGLGVVVLGARIFFMSVLKGVPFAWVGRDNRNPVIQGSTKWSGP